MSNILPERAKNKLILILDKIETSAFGEEDISELLRYIRPFSKNRPLIWEFACFIAHTEERSMGLFKSKMDFCYSTIMFADLSANTNSIKLNIFEIEENIFKNVIHNNLKLVDEKYLIKNSGFKRKEAIKIHQQCICF